MSINRVMISGNLTRDSELRQTGSGMHVLGFGVAVNDRRKNPQSGEWEDYPNFIDCTMFGTRAEAVSRYLTKGTKVSIEGKLRWSQWERDGQKRSKIEVIVDELEFMSSRNADAQQGGYSGQAYTGQAYTGQSYGGQAYGAPAQPQAQVQVQAQPQNQEPVAQSFGAPAYGQQPSYGAPAYGNATNAGSANAYGSPAPSIDASSSVYDEDIPF